MIFSKDLTKTDIDTRLTIPTEALEHIEMPEGENNVDVSCRYYKDGSHGTVWTFRCNKRRNGHPKPAFTTGWLEFVRAKDLQIGDKVTFRMQEDEAGGGRAAQYTIRATRTITILGKQIIADI
ncbi:hypothetical protein EZV62_002250 [Acer yangbiense]|uniref:TF-B3 domain-containing protein n=1 Tax=Acer yangbiense TaxID=1000413 RepID=A0A5C7IWK2_9ROSI|nr:hypothetical protein EZV62_002250 [Acer yangbiense]